MCFVSSVKVGCGDTLPPVATYRHHTQCILTPFIHSEPVLFSLTIKQNILLGTQDSVSPARFLEVCKMAQCHEFVSKFPLGYDTPVAAGMLSGGQKQRIGKEDFGYSMQTGGDVSDAAFLAAIARAMIKNPKILLLDEVG